MFAFHGYFPYCFFYSVTKFVDVLQPSKFALNIKIFRMKIKTHFDGIPRILPRWCGRLSPYSKHSNYRKTSRAVHQS